MYATLSGSAELHLIEGEVRIDAEIDRYGHVLWRVELAYPSDDDGARLTFAIHDDQTSLPNLIARIDRLLDAAT